MKTRYLISLFIVCLAIGSLGFTSLFFYDYNTKIVMVEEVQEETGEDIASLESNSDLDFFHNWSELISSSSKIADLAAILLAPHKPSDTSSGYFLDLIKPPMF